MTNRRRPWHERLVRRVTRHARVTPQELARRSAGTSSSASSGFTRNPPLSLTSSSEIGRGGSSSNAQPLPTASRTTANAPNMSESSGTSMNPVAPGNVDGFVTLKTTKESFDKQGVPITSANLQDYAGAVDVSGLRGRQKVFKAIITPCPLSLMSAFTLLGSLFALLSRIFAVALVLAASSIGSLACQLRLHDDLPT